MNQCFAAELCYSLKGNFGSNLPFRPILHVPLSPVQCHSLFCRYIGTRQCLIDSAFLFATCMTITRHGVQIKTFLSLQTGVILALLYL